MDNGLSGPSYQVMRPPDCVGQYSWNPNAAVKVLLSVTVLELIDVHLTDANALKLK